MPDACDLVGKASQTVWRSGAELQVATDGEGLVWLFDGEQMLGRLLMASQGAGPVTLTIASDLTSETEFVVTPR